MTASRDNGHRNVPITVGDRTIAPGRTSRFELPFARLPTGTDASLPVAVFNGRYAGPHVWLSGAIHGDELNGVEIIRRVLRHLDARRLRGAVLAVPIVNVFGFINESRYLPDRRDLNRSFPGSPRGSLANRLAFLFMNQVVAHCSVGIDLHTATNHRTNVPQIRADLDDSDTLSLAHAFGAPFAVHARLRDGSLRQAANERDIKVLVYEAGQAHRFDEDVIAQGVDGVLRVLIEMGMVPGVEVRPPGTVRQVRRTRWMRARRGGIANLTVGLGAEIRQGQTIGSVSDAFGTRPSGIRSSLDGWVIARTLNPLITPGDALVHVATELGPDRDEPAERRGRRR
ncbi:succinylglutamate desuccinylase/aspartoacylase family protein [soil metagenome]